MYPNTVPWDNAWSCQCGVYEKQAEFNASEGTGFAAGVMVTASIWSLLILAMEQSSEMGKWSFLPAASDFWLGILFLQVLDHTVLHLHMNSSRAEGPKSRLHKTAMLVLAVTLHNLTEGKHSNVETVLFAAGFTVMMVLDVALG